MDFTVWFIGQIPVFLLSEPISALTALFILGFVAQLVRDMFRLGGYRF